jgi:ferric-dicitrate binding protein FerR (iron transport regulator)
MSDAPHGPGEEPTDDLTRLFGRVAVRQRPSAGGEAAAYAALHAKWRNLAAARRRRRTLAAAAAAVLAVAAGYFSLRVPVGAPAATVATLERIEGDDVTWRDDRTQAQPLAALRDFRQGQRLATGPESRLALRWHDGGSLRLDTRSRLEFVSAGAVRLTAGSLYFDSAGARGETGRGAPMLAVHTPAGEVVHIGTQFMVTVDGDAVVLSVREGQVKVTGDGFEVVVGAHEQLDLRGDGTRSVAPVAGYEQRWQWAAAIAPPAALDGRTTFDAVAWAARETGRRVVYETPAAETHARQAVLRGIETQTPARILSLLPDLTDLTYEIRDDAIVVSAP